MLRALTKAYIEQGTQVKTIHLSEMAIGYCLGCYSCWTKTPGVCVRQDDMAGIIPTMKEADVIFLGTPLYFNTMSGTLKVFVDRLTALGGNPHELKDRKSVKTKLVMASNCGYPIKEQFAALSLWIRHFCNMLDVELVGEFYTTQGKALTQPDAEVEDARARYIRYLQECGSSLLRFGTLSAEQKDKMSNSVLDFCKVPPKHRSGVCWARRLRMTQSGFESIVAEIASLAVAKGLTVATAESCTGGLVSARLVDWAGASAFFLEGAVTYSNEAKAARLDVRPETLARHGAVSAETAREMAGGRPAVRGERRGFHHRDRRPGRRDAGEARRAGLCGRLRKRRGQGGTIPVQGDPERDPGTDGSGRPGNPSERPEGCPRGRPAGLERPRRSLS
jgi:multimeric flavodoxin WrbA